MKYKLICLVSVVLMIVAATAAQNAKTENNRYHQHLETDAYEACSDHGEEVFCTHLPLMNIVTDSEIPYPFLTDENGNDLRDEFNVRISNDEMVSAMVEYYDNQDGNNHLTDSAQIRERAMMRVRGATSRQYDKKGYLIKFKEENLVDNKDVSLSGMTADSDWVLHGPYWDKSLVRNYLCYNLSGEIMDYAPNVRFIELFLNGEYMGLYLLTEKIGYNDDGRLNVTETDPDLTETSYILRLDRGTDEELYDMVTFASSIGLTTRYGLSHSQYEILYPSKTLTREQKEYIVMDISKVEKVLTSFDYKDSDEGYEQYIDVNSFVDYFIINEFSLNYDAMGLSTYLYKDVRGKYQLCVWDFNNAFDYYIATEMDPQGYETHLKMWYFFLFKDEKFVDKVIDRYEMLRKTLLSDEYLLTYIDETLEYLGPAVDRNFEKWGYTFDAEMESKFLYPAERNPNSHQEAVGQLKEVIVERGAYLDTHMDLLYFLSHESLNKKYNYDKGAADR